MRKSRRTESSFSRASSGGTSPQSPAWWRARSSVGFMWPSASSARAPGVATSCPRGKSGAAILEPPPAQMREGLGQLFRGDLLPTPAGQEHEPAAAVKGQRTQASAAAPPGEVATSRVARAVRGTRNRGGGGLDHALEFLAGDVRIYPVAEGFTFPLEPGLFRVALQVRNRSFEKPNECHLRRIGPA